MTVLSESISPWRQKWAAAQEALNKPPVEATPAIPSTYIEVSKAGRGTFGDVYFCLPVGVVASARSAIRNSSVKTNDLTSMLVAVKVADGWEPSLLRDELKTLKEIRKQSQGKEAEQRFFQLIDWDRVGPIARWTVTSTFPLCCDLIALQGKFDSMPEEFLWLVYTQLHEAIQFLHKTCTPPIAHGDLHKGNIVVGFPNPDEIGLPQLKLIDFGSSLFSGSTGHLLTKDTNGFLCILDYMIHESTWWMWDEETCNLCVKTRSPDNRTSTFYSFHEALNEGLGQSFDVDPVILQTLWRQFGTPATQSLVSISETSRKQIQDVILGVAKPQFETNQERIGEILSESK